MDNDITSLDLVPEGRSGSIVALEGGRTSSARLAALGFTPGMAIQVLRNSLRGPIIVGLLDTRIALGRGLARHVTVRRVA